MVTWRMWFAYEVRELKIKLAMWIAWALPARVAYWCAIRVLAHATRPMKDPTGVLGLDAIKAFGKAFDVS